MNTMTEPFIGREKYDGYDRHGTSKYVYAWRIGRGRWRIESSLGGIYVRLGAVEFTAGFNFADD